MPAKNMGRPNEERKVNELLKKLQALKQRRRKLLNVERPRQRNRALVL